MRRKGAEHGGVGEVVRELVTPYISPILAC